VGIFNSELVNVEVSVEPALVTTAGTLEGVRMSKNGNYQVMNNGVLVEYIPVAFDTDAFEAGLEEIGAELTEVGKGLMRVEFSGITFSFRLNPMVRLAGD